MPAIPVLLVVCATISLLLSLSPLISQIQRRYVAPASLVAWSILLNGMIIVNAAIWPNEDIDSWWDGRGLCDIEVKLQVAGSLAQAGAIAAILHTLSNALDIERSLSRSPGYERRKVIAEIALCYGAPFVVAALHYIIQDRRYYLLSYTGCNTSFDASWPTIPLLLIWNPILCCVAVYHAALVALRVYQHHSRFSEVLQNSSSSLTKNRFVRLFIAAVGLLLLYIPLQISTTIKNFEGGFHVFSWSRIHGPEWTTVPRIATDGKVLVDRWGPVFTGIFLFLLFGLGEDASKMYSSWSKRSKSVFSETSSYISRASMRSFRSSFWSKNSDCKSASNLRYATRADYCPTASTLSSEEETKASKLPPIIPLILDLDASRGGFSLPQVYHARVIRVETTIEQSEQQEQGSWTANMKI